jgi:hypothetical protein
MRVSFPARSMRPRHEPCAWPVRVSRSFTSECPSMRRAVTTKRASAARADSISGASTVSVTSPVWSKTDTDDRSVASAPTQLQASVPDFTVGRHHDRGLDPVLRAGSAHAGSGRAHPFPGIGHMQARRQRAHRKVPGSRGSWEPFQRQRFILEGSSRRSRHLRRRGGRVSIGGRRGTRARQSVLGQRREQSQPGRGRHQSPVPAARG